MRLPRRRRRPAPHARAIIDEAPAAHRLPLPAAATTTPHARRCRVLLVPPLAAPAICFDLRRGCSLAEHLLAAGHPTYLVEYGDIAFSDRDLGLEHWVDDVLPAAIRRGQRGRRRRARCSCSAGASAGSCRCSRSPATPTLPVALGRDGREPVRLHAGAARRAAAAAREPHRRRRSARRSTARSAARPRRSCKRALPAHVDRQVPDEAARRARRNLDDRDFLAQIEAVDAFMANMHAYPGRTMGQLYHRFFRVNDLADGPARRSATARIDLADVRVPVLSIAGAADVLAPRRAVHHVAELLPERAGGASSTTAPGGHLGVLTGPRRARARPGAWLDDFLADTARTAARAVTCASSPESACDDPADAGRAGGYPQTPECALSSPAVASVPAALRAALLLAAPPPARRPRPRRSGSPPTSSPAASTSSGLTADEATAKLKAELAPKLGGKVVVRIAGRRSSSTARRRRSS